MNRWKGSLFTVLILALSSDLCAQQPAEERRLGQSQGAQNGDMLRTVEEAESGSALEAYSQSLGEEVKAAGDTQIEVCNFSPCTYYGLAIRFFDGHRWRTRGLGRLDPGACINADLGVKATQVRLIYKRRPLGLPIWDELIHAPHGHYVWSVFYNWDHHCVLHRSPWFEPLSP
jgi:hypothetical protein